MFLCLHEHFMAYMQRNNIPSRTACASKHSNFLHNRQLPLIVVCIRLLQPLGVELPEVDYINVSLVYRLDISHARVDTQGDSTVDSSDSDSVTRLHAVHKVVVCVQYHSVRSLASWHVLCKQINLSFHEMTNARQNQTRKYGRRKQGAILHKQGT